MASSIQLIFYIVSPIGTFLAVFVAYLALLKRVQPSLLVQYIPNPDIPSMIDLVITNTGEGSDFEVGFSKPLPAQCSGIEEPSGSGIEVLADGLPAVAPNQTYKFDGGQYAGLSEKLGDGCDLTVSYTYKSPFGFRLKRDQFFILSVAHLQNMPTRCSSSQAIVDALKGPNTTTLQGIQAQLSVISNAISSLDRTDDQ